MSRCTTCGRRWLGAHLSCGARPNCEALPPQPNIPHSIDGLQLEGVIGRGGFATVFRARGKDGGLVAIKIGRRDEPLSALRMLHEAEAMRAIGPPFVPAIHSSGSLDDGTPYIVMECLSERTLASRLAELPE